MSKTLVMIYLYDYELRKGWSFKIVLLNKLRRQKILLTLYIY